MSKEFNFKQFILTKVHNLNGDECKNSKFQTIQFDIITQFSSLWRIDRTLSGATTPGQSRPESDGNKEVLCIPQSSSITRASPSDYCLCHMQDTLWISLTP